MPPIDTVTDQRAVLADYLREDYLREDAFAQQLGRALIKQNELRAPNKDQAESKYRDGVLPPGYFLFVGLAAFAGGFGAWFVCRLSGVLKAAKNNANRKDRDAQKGT